VAKRLADKIEKQIHKAGLPTGGAVPFDPKLEKNMKGKPILKKDSVTHGPKKGKKGSGSVCGAGVSPAPMQARRPHHNTAN